MRGMKKSAKGAAGRKSRRNSKKNSMTKKNIFLC